MADPAPRTENWIARENRHKPDDLYLLVGGTVEVNVSNLAPVLTKAEEPGDVLALDMKLVQGDDPVVEHEGQPVPVWKPAHYKVVVSEDQYHHVQIRWDGQPIARVPVIDDIEHNKLMTKQAKAQNAVAKVKSGESTAKTAVERVVQVVGDVAEGAKTVVKKVLKRATGQATKKAGKKVAPAPKKAAAKKAAQGTRTAARKAAKKTANKTAKKATRKTVKKAARNSARTAAKTTKEAARKAARKTAKKKAKRR